MNHKIKKVDDDSIIDFLFNPFLRTTYYNDYIVQKYPINNTVDHILFFNDCPYFYNNVGYVIYDKKEIIFTAREIDEKEIFNDKVKSKACFIAIEDMTSNLLKETNKKLKDLINLIATEYKSKPTYSSTINDFRALYLQSAIYNTLGTSPPDFVAILNMDMLISIFMNQKSFEELIEIYLGDQKSVNEFIYNFTHSHNFLNAFILYPEILKEAADYVKEGIFSEDEELLKTYLSKSYPLNSLTIDVETTSGLKLQCFNNVSCDGNVRVKRGHIMEVSFKDIQKVFHNKKIFYEKK